MCIIVHVPEIFEFCIMYIIYMCSLYKFCVYHDSMQYAQSPLLSTRQSTKTGYKYQSATR